jgi:RNA polymerase sigma-70 factor, ECF subfamily
METAMALIERSRQRDQIGPFQIEAEINAIHASAASIDQTDWRRIVELHDELIMINPSPIIELNRAIALAEVDGPAVALHALSALDLESYPLYHAARSNLLTRCGRVADAIEAIRLAQRHTTNEPELRLLRRREHDLQERAGRREDRHSRSD